MLTYLKNTHETPTGKVAYFYELINNNSLVRAYKQDNNGLVQIFVSNAYNNQFQRCRQDLNLQLITQAEFSNLFNSPFGG
jgi:hypothetical protein